MNKNRKSNLFVFVVSVLCVLLFVSFVRPSSHIVAAPVVPVAVRPSVTSSTLVAHVSRVDACRTYPFGGRDATEGMACNLVADNSKESYVVSLDAPAEVIISISTPVPASPVIQVTPPAAPPVVITSTPVVDTKEKSNNGNHYGNNRPDNNANDVNNKHNGCDVDCTGKGKSK